MAKFKDIKQVTVNAHYSTNVTWDYLEDSLSHWIEKAKLAKLNMNPDFQRGHVWTRDQQIAYVEFKLRGGSGSNVILFNCVGWMNSFKGPFVLVDGKQRLEAVRAFLRDEIPAFGHFYSEYEDKFMLRGVDFIFKVNDLKTRAEVLNWYIELNGGGTPHTINEIEYVRTLLELDRQNNK